jgi:streptogramin lyase
MWTANHAGNSVTRITPAGGMTTYSLPAGSSPFGIAYDNNGNMWTANYGNSSVTKISTK